MQSTFLAKHKNNRCKAVSQFIKQLYIFKILGHDTTHRLDCVMGYFVVKTKEKLIQIIELEICT